MLVRVPALDGFTTFDESRWINRSRWFATGLLFDQQPCPAVEYGRSFATRGLGCTLQIGYPGTTTMWAGTIGLLAHYQQTTSGEIDLPTFLSQLPIHALDPAVIAPTRLPLAIAGALFIPLFYGLLRKLFYSNIAVVAALIVALQPFHSALSRVLHHDALTTTFMVLSVLMLIGYWFKRWPWYWLLLSAGAGGLALLSKQVSWFLPPFVLVLAGITALYRWQVAKNTQEGRVTLSDIWRIIMPLIGQGVLWGAGAAITFVMFFPAMWVMPLEVLQVIFTASTGLAQEGHTHFFLGNVSTNPGSWFYPVGWLFRATPIEVFGIICGLIAGGGLLKQRTLKTYIQEHPAEVALLLYIGLMWLFIIQSNKKMIRYSLPVYPVIDIFVAMGLVWLIRQIGRWWSLRRATSSGGSSLIKRGVFALCVIVVLTQGGLLFANFPYYLTYHNPLFGGSVGAAQVMTIVGWGEGLNEAADYLNRQPEAESAQVVAERICSMVRPFFVGQVSCLNSSVGGIMQADYLVYYINVVQRDLQWPEQWTYFQKHHTPDDRVVWHGVDYVLTYRNPIEQQVNRAANSVPTQFTAFGYNLSPSGKMTLFWQNLAGSNPQLMVGLAPSNGVYPLDGSLAAVERVWVACEVSPDFVSEASTPGAIIESVCDLAVDKLSIGLLDLQLAVDNDQVIVPVSPSLLGVIKVDEGQFENVKLLDYKERREN